jgi:uncharacterized protein YkwD
MLLHSRRPTSHSYLCTQTAKLSVLLFVSLLLFGTAAGQEVQPQPVSRLIDDQAGASGYARARLVSSAVLDNSGNAPISPFSFQHATPIERTAFQLTNDARVASGLQPLEWEAELCRLARAHSEDMARRAFFDHETPEGLRPKERARAFGVYRFRVIAENIAYNKGYEDPAALAVDRWLNSSGHRANILSNRFQYSAIGSYVSSDGSVYLTQVFISR